MERKHRSCGLYTLACGALLGLAGCFATTSRDAAYEQRNPPATLHGRSHTERTPDAYPRERDRDRHRQRVTRESAPPARESAPPARDSAPAARRLD